MQQLGLSVEDGVVDGLTVAKARPGSSLRARRKLLGMTQVQLAAKVGCSWSHVKKVEGGRTNPSPESRSKFAAALDADPLELFAAFPTAKADEEAAAIAERRAKVAKLYADHTMPELGTLLGADTTTIWRDVHALGLEARPAHTRPKYADEGRVCEICGEALSFDHPSDHANRRGRYHRECYEQGSVVNVCPVCGDERVRPASHAHKKCCGPRCAFTRLIKSMSEHPGRKPWSGPSRRNYLRRLRAPIVGKSGGRTPTYTNEQARAVRTLKTKYPELGRERIAQLVSEASGMKLTPKQVRRILEKPFN